VDEAEREAGLLITQLAEALRERGRAGQGFLDWLRGEDKRP
jgi:hypothetical protein